MKTIFIDGSAGTTGLRIRERLAARRDVTLVTLAGEDRKDPAARRAALNACDFAFLCLPDAASVEAVSLIENPDVTVLDTSTAHRTAAGWAYGFPELSPAFEARLRTARRVAVPGCHASGFIALVKPLTDAGLLPPGTPLCCFSLTGYSGGGKQMIAEYEAPDRSPLLRAPRQYALGQAHKHLKEMTAVTGIGTPPVFTPVVADFYSGMEVTVPVFAGQLSGGAGPEDVRAAYRVRYGGKIVRYAETAGEDGFLSAAALAGKDTMEVSVHGNGERLLLTARFDNLGKGASGAAVECLNILMGLPPETGLEL